MSLWRGFWRLAFVLWLLGFAAILGLGLIASPSLRSPTDLVHAEGEAEPELLTVEERVELELLASPRPSRNDVPGESDTDRSVRLALELHEAERQARQRVLEEERKYKEEWEKAYAEWMAAAKPRYQTRSFRRSVAQTALLLAAWSLLVWGILYTARWIAKGFRGA